LQQCEIACSIVVALEDAYFVLFYILYCVLTIIFCIYSGWNKREYFLSLTSGGGRYPRWVPATEALAASWLWEGARESRTLPQHGTRDVTPIFKNMQNSPFRSIFGEKISDALAPVHGISVSQKQSGQLFEGYNSRIIFKLYNYCV